MYYLTLSNCHINYFIIDKRVSVFWQSFSSPYPACTSV